MGISRKDIYSYVATLFTGITTNIYRRSIPQTLNSDAVANGFIVITLEDIRDFSEISLNTYSQVRVYIEYFVPSINTENADGVMNTSKFDAAQEAVDTIIDAECEKTNQTYTIQRESILSTDDFYTNNINSFYEYITSFMITI